MSGIANSTKLERERSGWGWEESHQPLTNACNIRLHDLLSRVCCALTPCPMEKGCLRQYDRPVISHQARFDSTPLRDHSLWGLTGRVAEHMGEDAHQELHVQTWRHQQETSRARTMSTCGWHKPSVRRRFVFHLLLLLLFPSFIVGPLLPCKLFQSVSL